MTLEGHTSSSSPGDSKYDFIDSIRDFEFLLYIGFFFQDTLSISDEQTISEYVRYYHIKVSTILIPDSPGSSSYPRDQVPLAFYDSVAQSSGGSSRIVAGAARRSIETYLDLIDAFAGLLHGEPGDDDVPVTLHRNIIQVIEVIL